MTYYTHIMCHFCIIYVQRVGEVYSYERADRWGERYSGTSMSLKGSRIVLWYTTSIHIPSLSWQWLIFPCHVGRANGEIGIPLIQQLPSD